MSNTGKLTGFFSLLVFLVILYASYLLILLSLPYIHFKPGVEFLKTKQLIYHIDLWRYSFYIHVFSSPLIILPGLLQFNRYLIHRQRKTHKILGYIYIIVLLTISGPAAVVMAFYANGGYVSQVSFVILSILWILFTLLAFYNIKKGKTEAHVKWMIRSYALTLSAITLRFYAYVFDIFGLSLGPKETYWLLAYMSWIPNLLIAQLIISLNYPRYLLRYENNINHEPLDQKSSQ